MKKPIVFSTVNYAVPTILIQVDIPKTCSLCGVTAYFEPISANAIFSPEDHRLQSWTITFCCPKCSGIFHLDKEEGHDSLIYPALGEYNLPEKIQKLYPDFVSLYKQSLAAESYGLTDIAGMGFRKSLEFLVKKYAIHYFPDAENEILSETLGKTINRISVPQIQDLAKFIAWLGNDQTHISVKHPDYGIPEMKDFMAALSHYILMENYADNAKELTNSAKKR